jgi:hypothetical protein
MQESNSEVSGFVLNNTVGMLLLLLSNYSSKIFPSEHLGPTSKNTITMVTLQLILGNFHDTE